MESYVDTSRVSIRPIYKALARDIIEKNHYSGRLSSCRYPLGVFYQTDNQHQFFDDTEEKLIGVACYGFPVGRGGNGSIFKEEILENKNILELTRLFIHDGYGKNIESHVISSTFKWLKQNAPNIKVLVSYADPEQSHDGAIYSKYGSAAPKNLIKAIGQSFWLKKEATKHRYIYFLGNKTENRKFRKVMKHPEMKYPKNYVQEVEITKIEVENNKWEN